MPVQQAGGDHGVQQAGGDMPVNRQVVTTCLLTGRW